jgi:hypothetical protein
VTEKYYYWLARQAERDAMLWKLALIALALVLAWELLQLAPPRIAVMLRPLYLVGGVLLFAAGLIIPYISTGGKP